MGWAEGRLAGKTMVGGRLDYPRAENRPDLAHAEVEALVVAEAEALVAAKCDPFLVLEWEKLHVAAVP
jgi:hypothetical protein